MGYWSTVPRGWWLSLCLNLVKSNLGIERARVLKSISKIVTHTHTHIYTHTCVCMLLHPSLFFICDTSPIPMCPQKPRGLSCLPFKRNSLFRKATELQMKEKVSYYLEIHCFNYYRWVINRYLLGKNQFYHGRKMVYHLLRSKHGLRPTIIMIHSNVQEIVRSIFSSRTPPP